MNERFSARVEKHKEVVGNALYLEEQLITDYNTGGRRVDDELWKL